MRRGRARSERAGPPGAYQAGSATAASRPGADDLVRRLENASGRRLRDALTTEPMLHVPSALARPWQPEGFGAKQRHALSLSLLLAERVGTGRMSHRVGRGRAPRILAACRRSDDSSAAERAVKRAIRILALHVACAAEYVGDRMSHRRLPRVGLSAGRAGRWHSHA